jgi:hypothetical protein
MRPFSPSALTFAAGVLSLVLSCPAATAEDTHVGWIDHIDKNCGAQWRANDKAAPKDLHPANDQFRFLYPGESVRCLGRGSMSLQILDFDKLTIWSKDGWYKIHTNPPAVTTKRPENSASPTQTLAVNQNALNAFGRPAGRQRGFQSSLFSPAAESVVRASQISLRWNDIPGATVITLRLTDKYHAVLWEQVDVDAAQRQLVSPALRNALAAYRDKYGAGPLALVLTSNAKAQPLVQFSLLTGDQELALDKDLRLCDKQSGLLRSVCRTFAFSSRDMWNDAAEEYEAALRLAPESHDLLLAAFTAQQNIGNTLRSSELKAKLPAGTVALE